MRTLHGPHRAAHVRAARHQPPRARRADTLYHAETRQEVSPPSPGQISTPVIEGEKRRLRTWDLVIARPGTAHSFVGAGDGPCVLLRRRRPVWRARHPLRSRRRSRPAGAWRGGDVVSPGRVRALRALADDEARAARHLAPAWTVRRSTSWASGGRTEGLCRPVEMRKALLETRPRRSESDRVRQRAYAWIAVTTKLALQPPQRGRRVCVVAAQRVAKWLRRHVRIEYCILEAHART